MVVVALMRDGLPKTHRLDCLYVCSIFVMMWLCLFCGIQWQRLRCYTSKITTLLQPTMRIIIIGMEQSSNVFNC